MEIFVLLIIIVFGVLQIILFFKLWGMTNDVSEMKQDLSSIVSKLHKSTIPVEDISKISIHSSEDYDQRLDNLEVGGKVRLKSNGKVMSIMFVETDKIFCQTSILGGGQYFYKKDLEYIEKP